MVKLAAVNNRFFFHGSLKFMACNDQRERFCKQNELSRTNEDLCYIRRRDYDAKRPWRWRTYQHRPYGCKPTATCYPGQFYWDGFGPGQCNIDEDSCIKLRHNVLTNPNLPQILPTLPINMPRVRGYHDADVESELVQSEPAMNFKQCTADTEKSQIPYRWQTFDHLCFDPQETQYIIPEDTHNRSFAHAATWHRGGEPTRFDRQERYRNGCNQKIRYFPVNLSYSAWGY